MSDTTTTSFNHGYTIHVYSTPYYTVMQDRPRLELLLADILATYNIGQIGDERLIAEALFADNWRRIPK